MRCCLWCFYYCKKNGIPWCLYHNYSTSDNGGQSCSAYKKKDYDILKRCLKSLDILKEKYMSFKDIYFRNWYKDNKPFGFDVIDIRLGGVLMRIDTAKKRISQFLNKEIEVIDELEEEKLLYEAPFASEEKCLIGEQIYNKIATASAM